jgi:uncharacterized protein YjbI with pentapeptide repeats
MEQKTQQQPQKEPQDEPEKGIERLPVSAWRAIKGNAALTGALATLAAASIGLSGILYQQHVGINLAQQDAKQKQEIEDQQRQETLIQTYFDDMGELLLNNEQPLRKAQPTDDVSILAGAKTLSVLNELDPRRKTSVVHFLLDAKLIQKDAPIVKLARADLRDVDLSGVNLGGSDLSGANLMGANLSGANLSGAKLDTTYLSGADLGGVRLNGASLLIATLRDADLSGADLSGANLSGALLTRANLSDAKLNGADLSYTDLSGGHSVTDEQLDKSKSLIKATMPDGSTHG